MGPTARVAVSSDFLGVFTELPPAIQSKVSRFLALFQRDPTGPGINYERINAARNLNMRSVRIDDAWRGIVLKPEQGNVFLLLWVDRHNEAYAWASRHRCTVNAATGALQIFETVRIQETVPNLYPEAPEFQVMPAVFATGFMVGLIEWTCILALKPHLDWPQEQSVGVRVDLSHTAGFYRHGTGQVGEGGGTETDLRCDG